MCSWDQDWWKGKEEEDQPEGEAYLGHSLNGNQDDALDSSEDGIISERSYVGVKEQGLHSSPRVNIGLPRKGVWQALSETLSSTEVNLKEADSRRLFLTAHSAARVINPSFLQGNLGGASQLLPHIVFECTHMRQGMSVRPSIYHLSKIR